MSKAHSPPTRTTNRGEKRCTPSSHQNQEAVRIAQREYDNGLIDLLDVLEVQRNLYSAQDALAQI